MKPENDSHTAEFLLEFSEDIERQSLIFVLFLFMYLVAVLGNLLIILVTISDPHLHTPMYFFLSNLSLVDIALVTTTVPRMLVNMQTQSKVITYKECLTQMYLVMLYGMLDVFLLTIMAYDHFVAICHPLHYTVIMNPRLCGLLVLGSWVLSVLHSFLENIMALQLAFCGDVEILHISCELKQLIQLACSDTLPNNVVMYFSAVLVGGGPLAGILYSYYKIISSICGISSTQGKYKAFSTCVSHLSVVSLYYCTGLVVYLSSDAARGSRLSSVATVMYNVVTPTLNPFIYSLRNEDIKRTLEAFFVHNKEFSRTKEFP
ncbi:olfactory receptor 7A17-like [Sorex fumeus]|uniref:olfactory receptor 7A17-like n=1 Tax=Sorex fumeus TaxID=62283 RepID=UPI0024AE36E6|nr:olfactory receptor 7A17-like [Sorex fumeus]